jgi:type II secretory pathway pseudopilin PulG
MAAMLKSLQEVIEHLTSVLLALSALGAAGASLWQSLKNRKRITALHEQVNTRIDVIEERRSGHDRRQAPRPPG